MIMMTTMQDVPKVAGMAMRSDRSEKQISLEDIFTMIFQLFICDKQFRVEKQFRVDSRIVGTPVSGQRFEVVITASQNALCNKVIYLKVGGWQMNRIMNLVGQFERDQELGHRVRILMLWRRFGHELRLGSAGPQAHIMMDLEQLAGIPENQ